MFLVLREIYLPEDLVKVSSYEYCGAQRLAAQTVPKILPGFYTCPQIAPTNQGTAQGDLLLFARRDRLETRSPLYLVCAQADREIFSHLWTKVDIGLTGSRVMGMNLVSK